MAGKSIERGQSAQLRSGDTIELTLMGSDGAQLRQKEFRYLEPGAATPRRSPFMPRAHSLNGTSPRQALAPKDVNHLRDAMPKDKPSRSTRRGPEGAQQVCASPPNTRVSRPDLSHASVISACMDSSLLPCERHDPDNVCQDYGASLWHMLGQATASNCRAEKGNARHSLRSVIQNLTMT